MAIQARNLNESNRGYGHKSDQHSWKDGPLAFLEMTVDYYDNGGYEQVVRDGKDFVRIGIKTLSDLPNMNEVYLAALYLMGKSYVATGAIDNAIACFHIVYSQTGFEEKMLTRPQDFPGFVQLARRELEDIARVKGEDYVNRFQIEPFFSDELGKKKGGCFIATAAYGSPLAPEVLIFRDFRDRVLLRSRLGRGFVHVYYFASPSAALLISRSRSLRAVTRQLLLEPILRLLNSVFRS